ncbi:MAG: ATP-binding protein [Gemmatimonadota bacterium]
MAPLPRHSPFAGLALALCLWPSAPVADLGHLSDAWRWSRYGSESGLPSGQVGLLAESDNGMVWAGTEAGLAWYDGFQWHSMSATDGIPQEMPAVLDQAPEGRVLAVVRGVLYLGDRAGFVRVPTVVAGQPLAVSAAVRFGNGILLLAGDRLYLLEGERIEPFPTPDSTPFTVRAGPQALCRTAANRIYYRALAGVYWWDGAGWSLALPGLRVRELDEPTRGPAVLSVEDPIEARGTWEWSPGSPPRRIPEQDRDLAACIEVSAQGNAVVTYESGTVRLRRSGQWSRLQAPHLQYARAVLCTSLGDVWVAGEEGLSVCRISLDRWTYLDVPGNDLDDRVASLLRCADGSLWVGTDGGVEVYHPDGSQEWLDRVGDTPLTVVTALAQDRAGHVYVGSGSSFDGVRRWDGSRWQALAPAMGPVHAMDVDGDGRFWFLTLGSGPWVLGSSEPEPWAPGAGLPSSAVYCVAQTPDHALWFGTRAGLSRWRGGTWTHWGAAQGLPETFCLAVDASGRLWFGLRRSAASIGWVDGDELRFQSLDLAKPQPEVWDLAADPSGGVWASTNVGLLRCFVGRASLLGRSAGLGARRIWPLLLSGSRLFVGTQGSGVSVLNLGETGDPPPRTVLEQDALSGRSADTRIRVFPYRGQQEPATVPVRYRLDDGPWSAWRAVRRVPLRDLDYGPHRVQVQALGLYARIDSLGSTLAFEIPRPVYQRPAVAGSAAVLLLLIVALAVISVSRARRYRRALRTNLALERLLNDTLRMQGEEDWERLVAAMGRELRALVPIFGVSINLLRTDGTVRAYAEGGSAPGIHEFSLSEAPSLKQVHRLGHALYRRSPEEFTAGDQRFLKAHAVRSVVDAPFSGGTIAMNSLRPRAFSREDIRILERFALVLSEAHRRLQDLAEMARQGEQVEQARRLRMVSRLATGVAHEINNPLTHVIGYAELLLKCDLPERERGYAAVIRDAGQRAASITERLIAYNRRQQASPQEFDLSRLAAETLALVRYEMEMAHVRLAEQIEPHAIVRAHPGEIQQALTALLHNALDAVAGRDGADWVRLELRHVDGRAVIDVIDGGPGIPPDVAEHLFEPFFTTKPVGDGAGLGLSMCRAIAQRHGGQLTLVQGPGNTRFSLELPLHHPSQAASPRGDSPS